MSTAFGAGATEQGAHRRRRGHRRAEGRHADLGRARSRATAARWCWTRATATTIRCSKRWTTWSRAWPARWADVRWCRPRPDGTKVQYHSAASGRIVCGYSEGLRPMVKSAAELVVYVVDDDASVPERAGPPDAFGRPSCIGLRLRRGLPGAGGPGAVGCVVLDISMPGLNGLQVQERLTQAAVGIPVIALSARDDDETRRLARALGTRFFFASRSTTRPCWTPSTGSPSGGAAPSVAPRADDQPASAPPPRCCAVAARATMSAPHRLTSSATERTPIFSMTRARCTLTVFWRSPCRRRSAC